MIPKHNDIYKEFLTVINDDCEHRIKEIRDTLANILQLSDSELSEMLPSNSQTVFASRVGWCKTYLLKAKMIEKIKTGVYRITKRGKEALDSKMIIDDNYLLKYEEFRLFKQIKHDKSSNFKPQNNVDNNSNPDELINQAIEEKNNLLISDLKDKINNMDPEDFEKMILILLDKMGYAFDKNSLIHTNYVNDGGIDGIIKEDKFGFSNIYIQAKRYTNSKVSRPDIQQFLGAVIGEGGNKGLFITSSDFTKEAVEFANKQINVKLVLVNGDDLAKLMIKYNLGVSVETIYEIKKLDNDFFDAE